MGATVAPSSPPTMAHPRPLESGRQQAGGQASSDPVGFLLTDAGNRSLSGEPASSPAAVAQGQGAYALLKYSFFTLLEHMDIFWIPYARLEYSFYTLLEYSFIHC
jgi:hypothetical protein